MSRHPGLHAGALGRITYDSSQQSWTFQAGQLATTLTSTFKDVAMKNLGVRAFELLLKSVDVPLPSIMLDRPSPNANAHLYFPQILHAIDSHKGPDYAALYLIGSCTQCLQYRISERDDAWKDSAFATLSLIDRNYPELQISVNKLWDILRDLSSEDLSPESVDTLFKSLMEVAETSMPSADPKGQKGRGMSQERRETAQNIQDQLPPEGYELVRCNEGPKGELIDLLSDQIGLRIYNPIKGKERIEDLGEVTPTAGSKHERNGEGDEDLIREFVRIKRSPAGPRNIADRERDQGISANLAQVLLRRLWRRRVAIFSGSTHRHELLREAAARYSEANSEDGQAPSPSSPLDEPATRPFTIRFPPQAAERYWGESRDKVPSTDFDPFALPKVHVPGRTGILQPDLVEIPGLESAFAACQPHHSPPVSDSDIDFLISLKPQASVEPIATFKSGLCQACRRFNWPKLFARFLVSHDLFEYANQNSFVAGLRDHPNIEPYTVEFDDDWWPSEAIRSYPLSFFGWVTMHCTSCALCKLITEAFNGLGQSMPKPSQLIAFCFSEGFSNTNVSRAVLHFSTEELLDQQGGRSSSVSFELLDDGMTPLRSLKTISPMRMMTTHLADLKMIPWVVPPLVEPQLPLAAVSDWVSGCGEGHHACVSRQKELRGKKEAPDSFRLRLLDVVNDEVVRPFHQCVYVCLSYVWGTTPQYKATFNKLVCCEKKHTCGSSGRPVIPIDRSKLPQTIQDAMAVVEAIGERYLWVDALCIVQDDERELSNTLKFMSKIYENALFTIVAADGTNADAGLPGVRPNSRHLVNVTGTVDGIPLIQRRSFLRLDDTPWAKRAWTFQEALFSQSWLVFSQNSVYYSCPDGIFSEQKPDDNAAESKEYMEEHNFSLSDLRKPAACRLWADYTDKVRRYTERLLSYEQDILNAFASIMEVYQEKIGTKFCWGLPTRSDELFVLSLLWGPGTDKDRTWLKLKRRTVKPPRYFGSHSEKFPSWSWAGWVGGPVDWEWPGSENDAPLDICSELRWHRDESLSSSFRDRRLLACDKSGVLQFYSKVVTLSPKDLDAKCPVYMDDGTKWENEKKCCVLLASMPKHLPTLFFLVVSENAAGFCSREGVCAVAVERWHELERIAGVEFKEVKLK